MSVLQGVHYRTGEPVSVHVKGGRIEEIEPLPAIVGKMPVLAPGLVDLQINGYAGHDFNAADPEAVPRAARELAREGVTTFFPTVVTKSNGAIEASLRVLAGTDVEGIHLEGPFISLEDGPRGAHPQKHVKPPDWGLFRRWQEAAGGKIRIVTLSPEWPGATEFIEKGVASGLIMAIGHTSATPARIREAVAAGARLSTHLGNGSHLLLRRHDNYLWEQMAEDRLWASVIADGFHLPAATLKVILRAKAGHAFLVSDAVALAGRPPGTYETPVGGQVVLTAEGKLHLAENPEILAGSGSGLLKGVEHLVGTELSDFADAWDRASVRPLEFLGRPAGLVPGAPADLVLLRRNGYKTTVLVTHKAGRTVHDQTAP
jgi:N-acetylglucosamine-6-phosphate deacetylase